MNFQCFLVVSVTFAASFKNSQCYECGERYNLNSARYGYVKHDAEARIVGGKPAIEGDFPWIVSLQINGNHYCGGSIINRHWIVSAAHCAKERGGNIRKNIVVKSGTNSPGAGTAHRVVNIVVYPEFQYSTFTGDVSVMKVSPPFEFTEGDDGDGAVGPVCLPEPDVDYEGSATVAGWGYHYSKANKVSSELMALDVLILESKECQSYRIFNADKMICAGYVEGKRDACQGDSGGPLTSLEDDGSAVLIGIVSYGEGCAQPNHPGLYTRVSRYVRWIERVSRTYY